MVILGIETSCDDTCASIVKASGPLKSPRFKILSNVISSQIKIHKKYGGVMPQMAARAHSKNIVPVLEKTFGEARLNPKKIDLIAVTTHPGLMPALLIGVHSARALAWSLQKPILGIDHMQGHAVAHLLAPANVLNSKFSAYAKASADKQNPNSKPIRFPAIGLLVSGGHTQIILMKDYTKMKLIGETLDDAAGEAFDKVARLLGLPFPGGPHIEAYATRAKGGTVPPRLPRPMLHSKDFNFSFSGLKTAVLYLVQDLQGKSLFAPASPRLRRASKAPRGARTRSADKKLSNEIRNQICAEFQQAVIDVLLTKTIAASKKYKAKTIIIGGGVSANQELRRQLAKKATEEMPSVILKIPTPSMSLDNAAMIAAAGYFNWLKGMRSSWKDIKVRI